MNTLIIIAILYSACGMLVVSALDPMKEIDIDLGRIPKLYKRVLMLLIMGPAYTIGLLATWITDNIPPLLDKFTDWLLTEWLSEKQLTTTSEKHQINWRIVMDWSELMTKIETAKPGTTIEIPEGIGLPPRAINVSEGVTVVFSDLLQVPLKWNGEETI